jgi:chemotaxis protein methyltransferase CheR
MLTATEFDFLRSLVRRHSGITLDPDREYLVRSRLQPLRGSHGFASLGELVRALQTFADSDLERAVVEAMTTSETCFFRDRHPFEALRTGILPELIARRARVRRLRLWSAASASGQEAYSLAMLLAEHFPELADWEVTILATDLSRPMVERTREGRYDQVEVNRGLPAGLLTRHFAWEGTHWRIEPALRRLVHARQLNLTGPWPDLDRPDVVLLRNVLIYFDEPTRHLILERTRRAMSPDGVLFLGSAETATTVADQWVRIQRGPATAFQPRLSARFDRIEVPA